MYAPRGELVQSTLVDVAHSFSACAATLGDKLGGGVIDKRVHVCVKLSSNSSAFSRSVKMPMHSARISRTLIENALSSQASHRSSTYTFGPAIRIPYYKNMGKDLALEGTRICPCLGTGSSTCHAHC